MKPTEKQPARKRPGGKFRRRQAAETLAGALIGGAIAGPAGAVVGAVAAHVIDPGVEGPTSESQQGPSPESKTGSKPEGSGRA